MCSLVPSKSPSAPRCRCCASNPGTQKDPDKIVTGRCFDLGAWRERNAYGDT